jgi:hypothetical protein
VTERHAKGSNVSSSPPKHQQNIPTPLENDCICSFDKQANNIYKSVCKRVPCQAKNKQEQKTDARSIRHSPTDRVTCLFYIECAAGVVLLLSIQSMFCQSSFSFSLHGGQILRFGRGFFKSTHKQNTLLLSLSHRYRIFGILLAPQDSNIVSSLSFLTRRVCFPFFTKSSHKSAVRVCERVWSLLAQKSLIQISHKVDNRKALEGAIGAAWRCCAGGHRPTADRVLGR